MVVRSGRFGPQSFGLLQVGSVKPLGKPAVNTRQELASLLPLALLGPQPTRVQGRPPLQRFRVLAEGDGEGAMPTTCRLICVSRAVASRMRRAYPVILLRSPPAEGADVSEYLKDVAQARSGDVGKYMGACRGR
jgi:hypothetical protein